METHLRRTLGAFQLLAIALTALLAARATGRFVELVMRRGTPALAAAVAGGGLTSLRAFTPLHGKSADDILARNVFCSTCPPIHAPANDEGEREAQDPAPVPSALPLHLVVIMVGPLSEDRGQSLALIHDAEKSRTGTYRVGMKVRDAMVVDIQATRVYLAHAGRREYLDLLGEPPPARAAVAAAPGIDPLSTELARGIKKVRDRNYEVQRATVDGLLGNMTMLAQSARIAPEVRDGAAVGFRLLGIKADGPFAAIGLQSGDVIRTINGLELFSADLALQAYAKLKTANHLSVDLERNGRRTTLDYNIR